jgi:hypothetical protein
MQVESNRIADKNLQKEETGNGYKTAEAIRSGMIYHFESTHKLGRSWDIIAKSGNPGAHPDVKALLDNIKRQNAYYIIKLEHTRPNELDT